MNVVELLLLGFSLFFALNIGGSGLAPSFSAALGARLISRAAAVALFIVFVTLGALLLGSFVAKTLGSGLVGEALNPMTALCVIAAASGALFLANLMRIPQSTSWVTVFAIATVGLRAGTLNADTVLYKLLPAWVGLPILSFVLTTLCVRLFYPPRSTNFRAVERLTRRTGALRAVVLVSSCYVATAIGSNNVANIVGPLAAANVVDVMTGFFIVAPLCGLGAVLFAAPAATVGRAIVPLGPVTATIANLVTGSVLLCASYLGIPQSLVHINTAAVVAISLAKEESWSLMPHVVLRRIGLLWLATPVIAAALTAALLEVVQ